MELFESKKAQEYKGCAFKLVGLCMLAYMISYFGRKSYDSNINEIIGFFGVDKTTVGIVGTCFFIAYAIFQVVHGLLCKYYNPTYSIFIAVIVGAVCNLLVGFLPKQSFGFLKYIWIVNAIAMASLWSPMIMMLNRVIATKHKKMALIFMSFPVSLGTFLTYGASALFSYLGKFKFTFFVASIMLFIVGIFWLITSGGLIKKCKEERDILDGTEELKIDNVNASMEKPKSKKFTKSFMAIFIILSFCAIVDNFLKDGINTWTPTILNEEFGLINWLSVLLTVLLPCFAVAGSFLAIYLSEKIKSSVLQNIIMFLASLVVLVGLILFLKYKVLVGVLACFILLVALMSGVNNVITNIFPMKCDREYNTGLIAGLLDGFCYVGSAISSFGLGAVAQGFGWNTVMYIFLIACGIAIISCSIYYVVSIIREKKRKTI